MIEISHLTKRYGKKEAVRDVSLQIGQRIYGLAGENGAGKTTFIRMLAGVLRPDQGEIRFDGKNGKTGYLPQKFGCFPELTVYEQMKYFACMQRIDTDLQRKEILEKLTFVHLEEQEKVKCRKLSGGMIRRLGIAQALLGNPELVLMDEPTVGLDPGERERFYRLIHSLEGKTAILFSTHLLEDIRELCERMILMENGRAKEVEVKEGCAFLMK